MNSISIKEIEEKLKKTIKRYNDIDNDLSVIPSEDTDRTHKSKGLAEEESEFTKKYTSINNNISELEKNMNKDFEYIQNSIETIIQKDLKEI